MNLTKKFESFLFEAETWKVLSALALISIVKTGIWAIPNLEYSQVMAQDPFVSAFPDNYLMLSWLGLYLAWLVGAVSFQGYFLFHLLFSVASSLLFVIFLFSKLEREYARIAILMYAMLPVSTTAYFWVSGDALTLFLLVLAFMLSSSWFAVLTAGALLGMQHFEQGAFAAAGLLLALALSLNERKELLFSVWFPVFLLAGVCAGKLALSLVFQQYGIDIGAGRIEHVGKSLPQTAANFLYHFQWILWSVLGVGWLIALRFADIGKKSIPFFVTLGGQLLLLPLAWDQTRVLAIVTFPLVVVFWLTNESFLSRLSRRDISNFFMLWLLLPWGWVWRGLPQGSVFSYDVAYVLHHLFNWPDLPVDLLQWPFK